MRLVFAMCQPVGYIALIMRRMKYPKSRYHMKNLRNPVAKALHEDDNLKVRVVQSKKKKHKRESSKVFSRKYTEHIDKEEDWDV